MTLATACQQPPSATLLAAVRQFNEGAYFLCHETLEELWNVQDDPLRDLYKGVLQIAVGLLHLEKGNIRGARALLQRGTKLSLPMAPHCLGLELADLHAQVAEVIELIDSLEKPHPLSLEGQRPQLRIRPQQS
ncbi:MAG: DUF309 domain-containing protein [Desulfuromonas sp.]|nr:MAG: DUF309 domain-containing protein [Desulfuromonas sp.]